jgi:hypothetical protein
MQRDAVITDEQLMAFADGALDDAEADAVAAAIAGDDALVARLEALERAGRLARDAFAGIAAAPVPARLVAAVVAADAATTPVRAANDVARPALWRIGAAVAAGLVAGVVLGPVMAGLADRRSEGATALAALPPRLEAALAQGLSGERIVAGEQRSFTLVASHRMADGTFCRSFTVGGSEPGAGLACNRAGRWQVDAFLRSPPSRPGDGAFRPASGVDPLIEETLERGAAGAPLSATEEAEARARGWRGR